MTSLLLYFVGMKNGVFSKVRIRSFRPQGLPEALRIFSCNADHQRSWHQKGSACLDTWLPLSDQCATGLVYTFSSLDSNNCCYFDLDCLGDDERVIGQSTVSVTYSEDRDQAVLSSLVSGSQEDELYFYYLFAYPYTPPQTEAPVPQSIRLTPVRGGDASTWPPSTPILIGHGGAGMKRAHFGSGPTWPDNTICAFRRAEQLGLPMVECDATVTRDYHTVLLHHNFTLRFTPSLCQGSSDRTFHLEHLPDPPVDEKTTNLIVKYSFTELRNMLGRCNGTVDVDAEDAPGTLVHPDPLSPSDPPPDPHGIQGFPLPELADALRNTSVKLGFNVELKYPKETMLGKMVRANHEGISINGELSGPHSYFASVNKFCERILDTVWKHAGSRVVLLSSFNADVCAVLRLKQSHLPVLFITRGECRSESDPVQMNHVDVRHDNLGIAISWAEALDLAGVVTLKDFFSGNDGAAWATQLAERKLSCFVYGVSEPSFMTDAEQFGLTGVIIDRVEQFIKEHNHGS